MRFANYIVTDPPFSRLVGALQKQQRITHLDEEGLERKGKRAVQEGVEARHVRGGGGPQVYARGRPAPLCFRACLPLPARCGAKVLGWWGLPGPGQLLRVS